MAALIRKYEQNDILEMCEIWNSIVDEGISFPQEHPLTEKTAQDFFGGQTFCAVAVDDGQIVGLYILHPNNVGRCGHISNASYAVKSGQRGKKIGEGLVLHSLDAARAAGFKILQFNAVVSTNYAAIYLYEKLGFIKLGTIKNGFRMKNGEYADINPLYITL